MSGWLGGSWAGDSGVAPVLTATITGGDSQQDGLATVALEVVATGGAGGYVYAWTLTDPTGSDRSALLDDDTIADPVFTPDQAGGGGQWVARCMVTSGSASVEAVKVVTVGQDVGDGAPWVLAASIVSDGATDASVSGGNIVWGGVTFAAPNTGVSVVDGDLVLANAAGSVDLGRAAVGTRTAPLVTVALSTLAGLAALSDRQVLIVVDVESYAPSTTNEALRVGLEQASAPIGSGSGGRGVCGGHSYSTTLRASSVLRADGGGTGDDNSTATTATIAGVGLIFASGAVRVYTATTAYADAAAVLADAAEQAGGMRASATMATMDQVVIAATKPTAGGGAVCTIRGLQVWVR
jgi:hypothetical protein